MSDWDVAEQNPVPASYKPHKSAVKNDDWEVTKSVPLPVERPAIGKTQPETKSQEDKTTTLEHFMHGFEQPFYGLDQLVEHIIPFKVGPKSPGYEQSIDDVIKEREALYQKKRGPNAQKMDWTALAGEMLNPVNYVGEGATKFIPAIERLPRLANVIKSTAMGASGAAMQPVTDSKHYAEEKLADVGIGSALGGIIGVAGSGVSKATQGFGAWLARNNPENLDSEAVRRILRRVNQDAKYGGPTAQDAIDVVQAAKKSRLKGPIALADIGGANLQGLAGNVARKPGESQQIARQFLVNRDAGATKRLDKLLTHYLFGNQSMKEAIEALVEARSVVGKAYYDNVWKLQGIWSPRLEEFLQAPIVQEGLQKGYQLESLLSLAKGEPLTATQLGVDIGVDGSIKMVEKPNMRMLDMAKQGLDAIIAEHRDPITGRMDKYGVAIDKVRRAYLKEIDNLDTSGIYKHARDLWGGFSTSMDSIRLGRTIFQTSPEEQVKLLSKMSDDQKEFYRLGVASSIREKLLKTGFSSDEGKQLLNSRWTKEQLKPSFKTPLRYNRFVDSIAEESKMFDTKRAMLGGSQTQGRMAEEAYEGDAALAASMNATEQLLRGHVIGAAKTAYRFLQDTGLGNNEEINSRVAKILFTNDLPTTDPMVQQLIAGAPAAKTNALRRTADVLGRSRFLTPPTVNTVQQDQGSPEP